jgi:hypothetical protein
MLTQEKVKQLFDYDHETGLLTRLTSPSGRVKIGDVVGCIGNRGYLTVSIDSKRYLVHRIIWLWVYGGFPEPQTDHINHDRTDNRISNLRESTQKENHKNRSMHNNNTSGVTGVFWDKRAKKWGSQIVVNDKNISLGYFDDKAGAAAVRLIAEIKYGFHPNHGKPAQKETSNEH